MVDVVKNPVRGHRADANNSEVVGVLDVNG